jgi:hypothetical protein
LPRLDEADGLIVLDLNLIPRRKECVEAHNEVRVPFEQVRHPVDYSRGINAEK